jgi:hypothetical protein
MQYRGFGYVALLTIVIFTGCKSRQSSSEQQVATDSTETTDSTPLSNLQRNSPAFTDWTNHYHINASDSFIESGAPADIYVYPNEINLADYELYKPLLVYNGDSSRFIDAYSYWLILDRDDTGQITARNGEPDVEVAVIDVKTKKRKRIFFCGSTCMIQKAFWLSNDMIAIAGMVSENADEQYKPVVWFVNTTSGSTTQYDYQKTVSSEDATAYFKKELGSKDVVYEE